jgi:hypothetical protein
MCTYLLTPEPGSLPSHPRGRVEIADFVLRYPGRNHEDHRVHNPEYLISKSWRHGRSWKVDPPQPTDRDSQPRHLEGFKSQLCTELQSGCLDTE